MQFNYDLWDVIKGANKKGEMENGMISRSKDNYYFIMEEY